MSKTTLRSSQLIHEAIQDALLAASAHSGCLSSVKSDLAEQRDPIDQQHPRAGCQPPQ